jgi:hypothetical protein
MKAERTFVETEDDGKINWSPNGNGIIAVVNKDQKNKYGEYPGWRIAPGEFPLPCSASLQQGLTTYNSVDRIIPHSPELLGRWERPQLRNTPSLRCQAQRCRNVRERRIQLAEQRQSTSRLQQVL